MQSISKLFSLQYPAEAVGIALAATAALVILLLMFILSRRAIRARYFARRDRRAQYIRQNWEKILSGGISPEQWFYDRIDHSIVEGILLDRVDVADAPGLLPLQELLRNSGLLDKRIREVRSYRGWRRRQSLLALGRMRLPECIPALAEVLTNADEQMAVDAIRSLGHVGTPKAAEAILQRFLDHPLHCPPQILQSALLQCYRSDPSALLQQTLDADDAIRPILARVLAEVATPRMSGDLLALAADPLAEVRASAARLLSTVRPHYALHALGQLAADQEWFVRLRAAVAIGKLGERRGIPMLVRILCDSNRLVRLRAASALTCFQGEEVQILERTMQTNDRYALQMLVSEMERSGRIPELVSALADDAQRAVVEPALLAALRGGSMHILVDLLLSHSDRRVRHRLARLLAASGDAQLLRQLERVEITLTRPRQKRIVRWAILRIRESIESLSASEAAVAI